MSYNQHLIPVAGHLTGDDFCVVAESRTYVHRRTGRLARVASFSGWSVWLILDNGTKNNYSIDVWNNEFDVIEDPHKVLCKHCGFLPVAKGDNLCENCQGTGAV
jgi:hypothetical protein